MLTLLLISHQIYRLITHMVVLTIDHTVPKHSNSSTALRLDYNRANWESINEFLYQYDFNLALSSSNTEFIWTFIKTVINRSVNQFIPKFPVKHTHQPNWFNSTICHKIKCLHSLRRKYTNHPIDSTKVKLTNLQVELQLMITEAKSEYKSNLALAYAHSNNSRIFQYVQLQFSALISKHQRTQTKPSYSMKYFYSVYTSSKQQINDCKRTAGPAKHYNI